MSQSSTPLVSVVTPVYNGAAFLGEAIRSVQAQTYPHWDYAILDNQSSDGSDALACAAAADDPRISVRRTARHLPMIANWNEAMRQISPEAAYVKVLHADDLLFPACLEQMVSLAEANPSVGIVAAYRLSGDRVELGGLPFPSPVTPGRVVARGALLDGLKVFGSPSSLLLRAELVRAAPAFYNAANRHADTEACFEILRSWDLGFVHQVLTYTRRHPGQVTALAQRQNSFLLAALGSVERFGPVFLSSDEHARSRRRLLRDYYRFLGRSALRRDPAFWDYHRQSLGAFGLRLSRARVLVAAVGLVLDAALNPKRTVERRLKALRRRVRGGGAPSAQQALAPRSS